MLTVARARAAWLAGACVLWGTVAFVGFFPGLLSADTLFQLDQGLRGEYTTVHSPLLSWVLGGIYRLSGSVWPAFALQLATLSGFMAVLAWRSARFQWAAALFAGFLLCPPVWSTVAAVWKDNAMTAALLAAVVMLALRRPWWAVVVLCAASSMRLNAALAAAPLLIPASAMLTARWGGRWWQRGIAIAVGLVLLAATPKLVERALSATDSWTVAWLYTDDLAAIYQRHPELYPGSMFESVVTASELSELYNVNSSVPLFFGPGKRINLFELPNRREELRGEWSRVVREVPGTYLATRTARFRRLTGADDMGVSYPFHTQIDPNDYGLKVLQHTWLNRTLRATQELVRNSVLFRGWFWASLLIGLGVVAVRRRRQAPLAMWVVASALCYLAGYFPLAPAADFRYQFWLIVASFCVALLLLGPDEPVETSSSTAPPV